MSAASPISGSQTPSAPPLPHSMVVTTAQKVGRVFYLILSIIIFPIGIARLIGYAIHQAFLHKTILPLNGKPGPYKQGKVAEALEDLSRNHNAEQIRVPTPHNDHLDALFIPGTAHPEKVILFACPNNAYAAEMLTSDIKKMVSELGASCCAANPPGVGNSEGSVSLENLDLTVYSMLHYLTEEKKIKPEDIVVYGYSIGGMELCRGVKLFEEEHPEVKIDVVHDRSFSSLTTIIKEVVRKDLSSCLAPLAQFTAWSSGLISDAKDSFDHLRGRKLVIYHTNDESIPYPASLAQAIFNDERYAKSAQADSNLTVLKMTDNLYGGHLRNFEHGEKAVILTEMAKMLDLPFTPPAEHTSGKVPSLEYYNFTPIST